jgi:thiosulfate reductase cytochrome b subunit
MKAATERKIIRWLHLLLSIPILGFIYGPVAGIPRAAFAVRFVFLPVVILSGLWLWKGHVVRRWLAKAR